MHREEAARQLPSLPADRIIGEPCGRDTAACIGLGAALIARQDPQAVMIVTPADHVIEPVQEFRRACHVAEQMVEEHPDALVTFGIRPEDLRIANGSDPAEMSIEAVVEVIERLGSEILLDVAVGPGSMVAAVEPTVGAKVHERLRLAVNPHRLHFFDADSEAAI